MPIYEYACDCGHKTEELEKEPVAARKCPACGKPKGLKRQISQVRKPQLRGPSVPQAPWRVRRGRGY
jgi:putative FmdB family regulatory protein